MKKQLSPATLAIIIGAVLVVALGLGFTWFQGATGGGPEDPALLQKQLEFEQSKRPAVDPNAGTNAQPAPTTGYSPGRGAELDARKQTSGGQ